MTKKQAGRKTKHPQTVQPMPKGGGEGNREADRHYRESTTRFARSGNVESAAEEAQAALEGPEGEELREAERKGRAAGRD